MEFAGVEKAFCVLQFAKCESIVTVQRQFLIQYHKDPPTDKPIRTLYNNFYMVQQFWTDWQSQCWWTNRPAGPSVSEVDVACVREAFTWNPQESTHRVRKGIADSTRNLIYQQDGAPPHFHHDVRGYLNYTLPHLWIGCSSRDDSSCSKASKITRHNPMWLFLMGLC